MYENGLNKLKQAEMNAGVGSDLLKDPAYQHALEQYAQVRQLGLAVSLLKKMLGTGGARNIKVLTETLFREGGAKGIRQEFGRALTVYNKAISEIDEAGTILNAGFDVSKMFTAKGFGKAGAVGIGGFAGSVIGEEQFGKEAQEAKGQDYDPVEHYLGVLGWTGAGMATPGVGGALFKTATVGAGKAAALFDYMYFAVLQTPSTLMTAGTGALGGTLVGALEQIIAGLVRVGAGTALLAARQGAKAAEEVSIGVKQAAKGMKVSIGIAEGPYIFGKAMKDPEWARREILEGAEGRVHQRPGILGIFGRIFQAMDSAAVNALKKANYTANEGAQFTLAGTPATQTGRAVLDSLQGNSKVRQGMMWNKQNKPYVKWAKHPGIEFAAKMAFMFPRVGILAVEGGIARIPGMGPAMSIGKAIGGRADFGGGLTPKHWSQGVARSATGAGGFALGHEVLADPDFDASLAYGLAPLTGPAIIPTMAGLA